MFRPDNTGVTEKGVRWNRLTIGLWILGQSNFQSCPIHSKTTKDKGEIDDD